MFQDRTFRGLAVSSRRDLKYPNPKFCRHGCHILPHLTLMRQSIKLSWSIVDVLYSRQIDQKPSCAAGSVNKGKRLC